MQTQVTTQVPAATNIVAPVVQTQLQAMQTQQEKLQAQIAALQAQQQALADLSANLQSGEYFVVKPSHAQTNVGILDLPKLVTLVLQALPLVQNPALLPAVQQQVTQLLLQACYIVENNGAVPATKQRIAQVP